VILKLVGENVRHRPLRTLLSVLLIAVPVTLILTLVGLSRGYLEDAAKRTRGVGADLIIRPPNSSMMQFTGNTISPGIIDFIRKQPHIAIATGVVAYPFGGWNEVTGIIPDEFEKLTGGFTYLEGRGLQGLDDILFDTFYAEQTKAKVGQTVQVINHTWHLVGIIEPGKLSHLFVLASRLQELSASHGYARVYIKLDDKHYLAEVKKNIEEKLPGYPLYPMEELVSLISIDRIPYLKPFINVIIGVGVLIAFAVVSLSMYMAILQRTREIGILKSLGATRGFILQIIMVEAMFMALGGTILGIALSFGTRWAIMHLVPASLPQAIVPTWWPIAGAIVVGASILGSLYPGTIAVRHDPIEALAYE
jgi:putative ABC transport system permease protein